MMSLLFIAPFILALICNSAFGSYSKALEWIYSQFLTPQFNWNSDNYLVSFILPLTIWIIDIIIYK